MTAGLAAAIRAAAASWEEAKRAGTAREPNRPTAVYPPLGHLRPIGDLVMAIAVALEPLDAAGFRIVDIASDRNEDRIVWAGPGERFVEVGCASSAVVIVGRTVAGRVPAYSAQTHRHARDVLPAGVVERLPSIELAPGETDIRTVLPACGTWAMAWVGWSAAFTNGSPRPT